MEQALRELKMKLTENLYASDYSKAFIIQTDASDKGIGVIMTEGEW